MKRQLAREQAFILIFEKSFLDYSIDEIIENAQMARELIDDDFARSIADGVFNNVEAIDAEIEKNIRGWSLSRISRVALAIMRLAVYEMLYIENIPVSVSINEAVELAKKYAGDEDPSYINGVLGSIAAAMGAEQ